MKAVILAAGKGERLGAITAVRPKPMIEIAGKPVIQWNVELCRQHGVDEIFINLHHLAEIIIDHLGDGSRFGVAITYAQEASLLGTAGGVKQFAQSLGDEPFLVVYGDNYSDYDLSALLAFHREKRADMSIALFHLDDVRLSGVALLESDGRIAGFVEKPIQSPPPSHWVNAGIYVVSPTILASIGEGEWDFGRQIIPHLIEAGRAVYGMVFPRKVIAIDTPALLEKSQQGL
ncbi:MAG: nucleotidyl [Rhodospirillaceae bacterium]|nr:MAG: nucleotidyl [Rhodospirillaceae bacterium]TNC97436.1 MAG: nucleotidyl transferase [Stygiobacter sp.]